MHDVKGGNDAAATTPQDRVDAETARPITLHGEPVTMTLTPAQADGRACITCGRGDQPMKPVEVRDGVQVFECTTHDAPLTVDQLAGRACVACGAQGMPMHVAGEVPGHGDVFECASHIAATVSDHFEAKVEDAVKLNNRPHLTNREAGLIFRLGSASSVILADELGRDIRDLGISNVYDIMSANEIDELVSFVRDLVARRQAVAK
ncbi:hypothetical protein AB0F17_15885 [Nonomuraea sp. NPDC026600]|uniref:hypothetical protein n=1 Tax=Nonomuraea sp. NPDC026600 TaxID=3155363 RepID=UPI00340AFE8C